MASQKKLALLRARYLADREKLLARSVSALQIKLYETVYNNYLSSIQQDNGRILNNSTNLELIKGLDGIYRDFNNREQTKTLHQYSSDLLNIPNVNTHYFRPLTDSDPIIVSSAKQSKEFISKHLGIDDHGMIKQGGYIDKFLTDKTGLRAIKKTVLKSLTRGEEPRLFQQRLQETIMGNKKSLGTFERYYKNFAYDTYQKFDRATGDIFAENIGLKYFIYSGTLIKTSRQFCDDHAGKIFSTEDAQQWIEMLNEPDGPIYDEETYDPLEDLGGYGCRHSKDYVSNSFAERNKEKFANR